MLDKIIKQALLGIILLTATFLQAQELELSNVQIIHDQKERSAVKAVIEPEGKDTKKDFRDFMDDRYKVEVEGIGLFKNKPVIYTEFVVIPNISNKPMQLFAKFTEIGKKTEIYVFGQFGDAQITPITYAVEYQRIEDLTVAFLEKILPNYYRNKVEDQEDAISDLEKDRDDMRKKINKNKDKIVELTKENEELADKLVKNAKELEEGMEKLGDKKSELKSVNKKLDGKNLN